MFTMLLFLTHHKAYTEHPALKGSIFLFKAMVLDLMGKHLDLYVG